MRSLLTRSDDFNALAAAELRDTLGHGHVYRVAPDPNEPDLLSPPVEAGILGGAGLTFAELSRRFAAGAHFITRVAGEAPGSDGTPTEELPLIVISADGRLTGATEGPPPAPGPGDSLIVLAP